MRKNFASRALGVIPFFLLLGSSCSLVYDLDPDQCSSNTDCVRRFGQGYVCDVGICTTGSGDAGSGGKGGKGGSSAGATAGTTDDGGMSGESDTGGKAGTAGTAGTGDSAGTGGSAVVECNTHNDCFKLYPDDSDENPRACVQGTCVPLKTPDCPVVLPLSDNPDPDNPNPDGAWNLLRSTNAVILGAFSPITNGQIDTFGRNYDLAVTELSDTTGGVKPSTTDRRQIVVVVCNMIYSTQDKLLAPAMHLMEELKVPGVASTLYLQDQSYVWENVAAERNVLMMMPLYSSQKLIDTPDNGFIWHMLSGANELSVSYQPLLNMTVDHLRTLGDLGATEDVKVAHVKARDEPFLQDTAAYLDANLQFNGQSVDDNDSAGKYLGIQVTSDYKAPTDKQLDAIDRILTFAPHVVIGTNVSEIIKQIIPGVEKDWDTRNPGRARPFYLLGALTYNDAGMSKLINTDTSPSGKTPLYQRILGVNWPAAADQSVYEAYQKRWKDVYNTRQDGYENFYDAMYYLLYGVAASTAPVDGRNLLAGLRRMTAHGTNVPQLEVGPGDSMYDAVNNLATKPKAQYELIGAMGPPNWDPTGTRNDAGSVWCVNAVGYYQPDQLRYDASDSTLQPSDPALTDSDIKCFPFPAE
jgi:hypothetical protein